MTRRVRGALLLLLGLLAPAGAVNVSPNRIGASVEGSSGSHFSTVGAASSTKYLIASFPNLKQVGYVHLPDNVWRPLVIGAVTKPQAVAVDAQNARLFVSDPPNSVIWWYHLTVSSGGLLETVGPRRAAVENFNASWMAVSSVGDLFFAGRPVAVTPRPTYDSIFRQDAVNLATGDSFNPSEAFSRANTGAPNPKAYTPSGLAVDSFYVYWGNEENGTAHGSVVKGSSTSSGVLRAVHGAVDSVRGVSVTGTHVFFASPSGIYGVPKTTPTTVEDNTQGLVVAPPTDGSAWDPLALAWDGENTLFLTDAAAGVLYSLPAQNVQAHNLTKFVDSPNVHGLAIIGFSSMASPAHAGPGLLVALAVALACGVGLRE